MPTIRAFAAALLALSACARAACPSTLEYSADVPVTLSGTYGDGRDYFVDEGGTPQRVQLPGLPARAGLDALQVDANGDVLFSLDTGATLDGTYYGRADVIKRSGNAYSLAFDAKAAGIPATVDLDAVARVGTHLLFSFDHGFTLGGTYIRPADVVEFDGLVLVGKKLDAAARGVPSGANLDALDAPDADTLLVSFDTGGQIGGITYADEDVLQLVLSTGIWSKPCTLLARSDRWGPANLDALSATPRPNVLFQDGFEGAPP